jgi:hypothetical protein
MFLALRDLQNATTECRARIEQTYLDEDAAYKRYLEVKEKTKADRDHFTAQLWQIQSSKEMELAKVDPILAVDVYEINAHVRVSTKLDAGKAAGLCKNHAPSKVDDKWFTYYLNKERVRDEVVPNALAVGLFFPTEEDRAASQEGQGFIMM